MTLPAIPNSPLVVPDLMTLGLMFAKSGYFADSREQAQAIVKILAGQELGFPPVAAMTGIYIVKGRVTMSANLIAAAIKRSGKYDFKVVTLTNDLCSLQFFEKGEPVGISEFSIADARTAGLITNETYRKFSRNMLFARAISNGAKWFCADIFSGPVYTPDELGALVDAESGEMIAPPADERPVKPVTGGALDRIVEAYTAPAQEATDEFEAKLDRIVEANTEPDVQPEPENGQTVIPMPPSELSLTLLRSNIIARRNFLKISDEAFAKMIAEYCGGPSRFGRATKEQLESMLRALDTMPEPKRGKR